MRELKKALVSISALVLIFASVFGFFSINAQAEGATDAATIDGVAIYGDKVAVTKDGVVLNGYDFTGYYVYLEANNVILENCTNIKWVKICTGKSGAIVNKCTIVGPAENGVAIEPNVTNSQVSRTTISGTTKCGINAEKAASCIIEENTINSNAGAHSIYLRECTNMRVSSNKVNNSAHYGITLNHDNGSYVENNIIDKCCVGTLTKDMHGDGLLLDEECQNTSVVGNTISDVKSGFADYGNGLIVGKSCKSITIQDNKIDKAGNHGLQVTWYSSDVLVESNEITGSGNDGISVSRDSQANCMFNKVHDNTGHGIVYDGHEHYDGKTYVNGSINGNWIYNNTEIGVFVQDSNVTIANNEITNNGTEGIRIEKKCQTKITGNKVGDNKASTGIHLLGTSVNDVKENYVYKTNYKYDTLDRTAGIRLEESATASLNDNKIVNYAGAAIWGVTGTTITEAKGNQAIICSKNEFVLQAFKTDETNNKNFHNNLYLKGIYKNAAKGQTFRSGYLSGAIVGNQYYTTESGSDGSFEVTFPETNEQVVLFTQDSDGNVICLNAPNGFDYTPDPNYDPDNPNHLTDEQIAQVRAFVERFYLEILHRASDAEGLDNWTKALVSGKMTGADVAKGVALSKELENQNINNAEFVNRMYAGFFDRPADQDGFGIWIDNLYAGCTRYYVVQGFVNSTEFKNLCARYGINPGSLEKKGGPTKPLSYPQLKLDSSKVKDEDIERYVDRLYDKVLHRAPDADGRAMWIKVLKEGKGPDGKTYDAATVASVGFFTSQEYKNKNKTNAEFVYDAYLAFFDRDPIALNDPGYEFWIDQLDTGKMSRKMMIERGFGQSKEFKDLLRSFGYEIIE